MRLWLRWRSANNGNCAAVVGKLRYLYRLGGTDVGVEGRAKKVGVSRAEEEMSRSFGWVWWLLWSWLLLLLLLLLVEIAAV